MLTKAQFRDVLQDALNHLHDPDRLGRSPLAEAFGVVGRFNPYTALQDVLTAGISALRPGPGVPADSRAWRIYDLLSCRYAQELSPPEVAHQLGLSTRHMYREQAAALDALADYLWGKFGLTDRQDLGRQAEAAEEAERAAPSLQDELAWLRNAPREYPVDLREVLSTTLEMAEPLAERHGTHLHVSLPEDLPGVAVHPVGLSQVLLNLLTTSIHSAGSGTVEVTAAQMNWEVEIEFRLLPAFGRTHPQSGSPRVLEATQAVADLCGMAMYIPTAGGEYFARVVLPAQQQVVVLAIDDNADTLRLLERYTVGSRYCLTGVRDPQQALELAETLSPQIIMLDVMMPELDGWRLLGRLRQHPSTRDIPVVVCTIIPQEELAYTLGAVACLRKPVTQEQFLEALDRQVAPSAAETC